MVASDSQDSGKNTTFYHFFLANSMYSVKNVMRELLCDINSQYHYLLFTIINYLFLIN